MILYQCKSGVPYQPEVGKGETIIGILFQVDKIQYFAPLSSPKAKHKKMPNNKADWKVIRNDMILDNQYLDKILTDGKYPDRIPIEELLKDAK